VKKVSRLKKLAENNLESAKKLLERIDSASDDLKDRYYVLFDNLNALYEAYPDLYKEMEMTVKLPKNDDGRDIMQFHEDLHRILDHFKDDQYLESNVGRKEGNEDEVES
jgi:hypothetical protein